MAATMEAIRKIKLDMKNLQPFIYTIDQKLYFIGYGALRECLPVEKGLFEKFVREMDEISATIDQIKFNNEKCDNLLAIYKNEQDNFAELAEVLEKIGQYEPGSVEKRVVDSKQCELNKLLSRLNTAELQNIQKQIQRYRDASEYANRYELLGKLQ